MSESDTAHIDDDDDDDDVLQLLFITTGVCLDSLLRNAPFEDGVHCLQLCIRKLEQLHYRLLGTPGMGYLISSMHCDKTKCSKGNNYTSLPRIHPCKTSYKTRFLLSGTSACCHIASLQ